jgi:hypothetical protein
VDQLEETARSVGATFHELCLLDERTASLERFAQRGSDPLLARHHEECLHHAGGAEGIARMYDELLAFLESRPSSVVVRTRAGDEAGTLAAVLTAVG